MGEVIPHHKKYSLDRTLVDSKLILFFFSFR